MKRGQFIKTTARGLVALVIPQFPQLLLAGCGSKTGTMSQEQPPDIMISENDDRRQLVAKIRNKMGQLWEVAQLTNPNDSIRIGSEEGEVVRLGFKTDGAAKYRHPIITQESTGEQVELVWGEKSKGIIPGPSLKLVDPKKPKAKPIEIGLDEVDSNILSAPAGSINLDRLFTIGITVAAAAFAVWLAATVGKLFLSAVGAIAVAGLMLGILAAGIAFFGPIINNALKAIGIDISQMDLDFITNFFKNLDLKNETQNFFDSIARFIEEFI